MSAIKNLPFAFVVALAFPNISLAAERPRSSSSPMATDIEGIVARIQMQVEGMRVVAPFPSLSQCMNALYDASAKTCITPPDASGAITAVASQSGRYVDDIEVRLEIGGGEPSGQAVLNEFHDLCTAMLRSVNPRMTVNAARRAVGEMNRRAINLTRGTQEGSSEREAPYKIQFSVLVAPRRYISCHLMQNDG